MLSRPRHALASEDSDLKQDFPNFYFISALTNAENGDEYKPQSTFDFND